MDDKSQEYIDDVVEDSGSSCCGAGVALDRCLECGEPCELVTEE